MKVPSLSALRALRAAAEFPVSTTSSTSYHKCPRLNAARKLSTTSHLSRAHPAAYNNPMSTSIIAPRTPNLAPKSRDRGPSSKEETQTDFGAMNILSNTPPPATAIDACLSDGFHLSNGVKITNGSGVLLVGGEAFSWRPWEAEQSQTSGVADPGVRDPRRRMVNQKSQFEVEQKAWGLLDLVWPKPELLIVGLGGAMYPLSKETRAHINELGIRVDILDTRNAAAQFNLLATERGVGVVAAAMLPIGWKVKL